MATYLSQEKLEEMKEELKNRRTVIRKEIADRIATAKELGDLSENFEYHEAKEAQGLNETRIVQLESMIRDVAIVEETSGGSVIQLGVSFVAEVNEVEKTFQIVGANEADPMEGKISNESPIGNAFLGAKMGETVKVEIPSGTVSYKILRIL